MRDQGTGRSTTLAQHIIQSFAPGEVTPEQALAIGNELCERYLKDQYQYVLAVHTDHEHIHCHIICNNTNLYTHRTFETEENQGGKSVRAWAKLREISDEICKEHGLSVIEPKGKGVSHFERDMQIQGKSWKDKLRAKIAEVAIYSKDFNDFLQKCVEGGTEYVYTPRNKVKLKFRLKDEGQQRFTRADTLGEEYTPERIAEQIEQIQKALSAAQTNAELKAPEKPTIPSKPVVAPKTEQKPTPPQPKTEYVYQPLTEDELDRIFGISSTAKDEPETSNLSVMTEEEYIKILEEQDRQIQAEKEKSASPPDDPWKEIRGMRDVDEIIEALEEGGVDSFGTLASFFFRTDHKDDHTDKLAKLKKKFTAIDTLIEIIQKRDELASIYKEYESLSGFKQKRFKKKNSSQIEDYEEAVTYIKEHSKPYCVDGEPPTIIDLMEKSNKLKTKYNGLLPEHNAFLTKQATAKKYTKQVRKYLDEQRRKREQERSRQRVQQKQKKTYLE